MERCCTYVGHGGPRGSEVQENGTYTLSLIVIIFIDSHNKTKFCLHSVDISFAYIFFFRGSRIYHNEPRTSLWEGAISRGEANFLLHKTW